MALNCQIVYHSGNCLNTKKAYAKPCRICSDVCPHRAISPDREIDPKRCTECGLCVAACPSDGLTDNGADGLRDYLFKTDTEIILNCPQAERLGFEIPCLGILDRDAWSTLFLLADGKRVTIATGQCAGCLDKEACAASVKTFKALHTEWPEHPPVKILVVPDSGQTTGDRSGRAAAQVATPPGKKAGSTDGQLRRPAGLRQWGRQTLQTWLPGLRSDETYPIPSRRQWLQLALAARPDRRVPFRALEVSPACTCCGVCAAVCPQGALQKREDEGSLSLVFEPLKCVQCERCTQTCPAQALSLEVKWLSAKLLNGKIHLHTGSPRICSRCGRQVFDNSEPPLCLVCLTSNPDRRDQFL